MAMRTGSLDAYGSVLAHSSDEESIVECDVLDRGVGRLSPERYLPVPARRGDATAEDVGHAVATVPSGSVSNLHDEAFDSRRPSKAQRPSSDAQQTLLMPLAPSQNHRRGANFTDAGRDVGFSDSFDGFSMYVDEDGVMKMPQHRRGDPFAFGYDAVEEGDFTVDGGRVGSGGRRSSYRGGDSVAHGSSFSSYDDPFVSGSSSYSSSLYEELYQPSQQPGGQVYDHRHRYANGTNAAAGYECRPLEMYYSGVAGVLATYDDDGAPMPINAALPSHHYVASRRRRLVWAGSNAHVTYHANRGRPSRTKGKRARGGDTRGGQLGRRTAKARASPCAPVSCQRGHRKVRSSSRRPTRLSCSGSLPCSRNPSLSIVGGGNGATTASAAVVTSIPGGLSALLSASAPIDVRPSEAEKATRMRKYLLGRQAVVERRYEALRRRSSGTASTSEAASGAQCATASPNTSDDDGNAAIDSDALTSQNIRGAWPPTPGSISLNDVKRSIGLNTWRTGVGTALASAATRSARLRAKDAPTQLQAVVAKEEAVYVRAGLPPASAAAVAAPGAGSRDDKGVTGSDGSPGVRNATGLTAGMATHAEQPMTMLHAPYTDLSIAPTCAPLTEAVAAVHTCAAGTHFFRDPTVPRPSELGLQPLTLTAFPATPSQVLPAACRASVGTALLAPMHTGAATVSDEGSLRASFSASHALTTLRTASSASAAYRGPASFMPAAQQPQPWKPPLSGPVGEGSFQSRSPRPLMTSGPSSATSLLLDHRRSHDGAASMGQASLGWRTLTKAAAFRDVRPSLASGGESADAGALPTAPSSGSGGAASLDKSSLRGEDQLTVASLDFGDGARSRWGRQRGAAEAGGGAGMGGGAGFSPWGWRCGVSALVGAGDGAQGGVSAADASKDEAARGWSGAWPTVAYPYSAAGEYDVSRPAVGASSSAPSTMPSSSAWPRAASPQLPIHSPLVAPYAAPCHLQQNTRYHAWTAEGVSATSSTSCVVHVFAVSRAMLRSVYEYVAYICVSRRYAEMQRRRRKRDQHLIKELAAGRLTREAQRYLRCPHCGVVGQVVRGSSSQRGSQTLSSSFVVFSTLAQSQHLNGAKHHHRHHHSPHYSPASRHPSLTSTTTTTTATTSTTPRLPQNTPRPLLFMRRSASSASISLDLPSQQQRTERLGRPSVVSPSPRWTSLPPHPPPRSTFGMASAAQCSSRVAVDGSSGKVEERQSVLRALAVDEVNAALAAPPESAASLSSPAAPSVSAAHGPLTRSGSAASGSLTALPPLARSASLPPLRPPPPKQLQEDSLSFEFQPCQSMSLSQLPSVATVWSSSPIPSPPPSLLIPAAASTAPPLLARLHASPHVSGTQGTALTETTRSSNARAEALLDLSVVSGELSQSHYLSSSPYETMAPATFDRFTGASSSDFSAQRPLDELAGAASPRRTAEGGVCATGEDAAVKRSSSRTALASSNSQVRSLRAGGIDSDAENVRLSGAGGPAHQLPGSTASQRWPPPSECSTETRMSSPSLPLAIPAATLPDRSALMADFDTRDATLTRATATAHPALAASADFSASRCAPPTSTNAATSAMTAVMKAFDAQVRDLGSGERRNLNTKSKSGSNSLLCSMAGPTSTSAVPPLARLLTPRQSEGAADDGDEGVVIQRWRDTDSRETARDYRRRSGGALYVCLGCHRDVIPTPSLLTLVGDYRSSRRHSHFLYHHGDARYSHAINNISNSDGDADANDGGAEEAVSADIGVMAFDDLLQDDAFVYALHASLCESLMMPSTREPPTLPTLPRDRGRKRSARTLPEPADVNDPMIPFLPVASAHETRSSLQLSPEAIATAATSTAGKIRRGTVLSKSTPSCLLSGEVHQQSPITMKGVNAVSSENIGSDIGDDEGKPTKQQCGLQAQQHQQRYPSTSPLSISAASSQASTSSAITSLESYSAAAYTTPSASNAGVAVVANREGGCCSAASLPIRFLLPCCGLKVSVMPHVEPQEKAIDGGSMRRGSTERCLLCMSYSRSKSDHLSRRRASASSSLSWSAIPRMREDAATRGLTPCAMVMSDAAAASQDLRTDNGSKQPRRLSIHRDTPPRQRRRCSLMNTAGTKFTPSLASPPHGSMMHNDAAWTALMMKGTFSSEKHRIQVNPRTPLDAVSKNRIMQRIFRQDRLGSLSDTTAVATRALSRSRAAVGPSSRTENYAGGDSDALASPAAPDAASTSVAAPDARSQRRMSAADGRSGAAAAVDASASARGSETQRHRCPHHRAHSYMHEQAQQHAHLLLPPKRTPKQLGLDLGAYHDPNLVLEIDVAYPRLHRGNVRELLTQWKGTCQPHPVLVEAVIRNIVYAVLVQLSALHAAGRTHGSVKSTNVFPLWHAMEGARRSGLMMPPRPRQRATSSSPLAEAHEKLEAGLAQEKVRKAEALKTEEKDEERWWSSSNVEHEGVVEPGGAPATALPAKDQVAAEEAHASTSAAAVVDRTLKSPTRRRSHSGRRRRRAPHAVAVHLRLHPQTRSRHRKAQSPIKAAWGTGTSRAAKSSASAALSGSSLASTAAAPSTRLATAMAAYRRRSVSVSVSGGGGTGADSKQDDASSIPRAPNAKSPLSFMSSSPSTVLLPATMPPSALTSGSGVSAVPTSDATQPYHTDDNSRSAATLSPLIGSSSKNARLRHRGKSAARLRRSSIGTNVVGDDSCDLNDDTDSEDDSALVPLIAEILAPSRADAMLRAAATTKGAAAGEFGTAEPQTKLQSGPRGTLTMNVAPSSFFAAVPRPRDHRHSHHRSLQGRGSCSAALEDPEEWLAAAVPWRYVRGVELRPPAAVLFPRIDVDKAALAVDKLSVDYRGMPSADVADVKSASDIAAQPVLTRGPVGAVPHPQLDSVGREETGVPVTSAADQTRCRNSPAGPSTSSSTVLHAANNGAGQDEPDPLQWSRQVLLVENVGAVVATALRTAMTCVLMQRPPRRHASPLPPTSASFKSALKAPLPCSHTAHRAADAVAHPTTAAAATQGLRPVTSQGMPVAASSARHKSREGAALSLSVHVPDVVHSPPPPLPNLFAIQESEHVPAPELIRFPVDQACALRRLWCQQPGDAAAVDEVKEEAGAGRCSASPHNPTITAADAGTEVTAQLREILARLEAAVSPAMTLRNNLDPYPVSSAAVDIWELGMMALELADGPPPPAWLKQREPSPALRTYPWSSYFHAFVSLCLQRAPEQRGTAAELLQHPWFSVALLPQVLSTSPPTCNQSGYVGWSQGSIGSGVTCVPVGARNVEATRQSSKAGRLAPANSPAVPLCSARLPGVMGVDCLTAEEKADWENYDYTLLYASGAPPARPHTTTAAAATAAVASAAEEHHPSGSSNVRQESISVHETQGAAESVSAVAKHAHEMPSLLGFGRRSAGTPSLSHAAPTTAVAMPSQSSALAAPSAGGRAAVALSSAVAVAARATTASANEELMTAMCAVDLAQNFAEFIMQQWVQQQQHLVPSLATAAAAATSNALSRRSVSPATGHGAMSQPHPSLFFLRPDCEEKMPPMWRGYSIAFNGAWLSGQIEVTPVISPRGASSPSPPPSSELVGGVAVRVLHAPPRDPHSDTTATAATALVSPWGERMMDESCGAAGIQSQLQQQQALSAAAHGALPFWFQGNGGAASRNPMPLMYTTLQTLPCRNGRASGGGGGRSKLRWSRSGLDDGGSTSGVSSGGDWDSSGNSPHDGHHTRAASGISSQSSSSSSTRSDSDSDSDSIANVRPRAARGGAHSDGHFFYVLSPNVGGEVPVPTQTSAQHNDDTFSTAPTSLIGDATRRGSIFKAVTPEQRAGGGYMTFDDLTIGGGAAAVKEGVSMSYPYATAPKLQQRGGDGRWHGHESHGGSAGRGGDSDYDAALRLSSSSHPTRHLLIGTIATALARLSMMANHPSDSDENWDETSSSNSEDDDSASDSDGSEYGPLSSTWGASAFRSTPLESGGKISCTGGYGDNRHASCFEEPDENDDDQSMSADVRCDELLRCLSLLQRRCPAAVGLWCVRVLQQSMQHPRTAASAVRVLERIESLLPAELERKLRWFKRPSASPSPWQSPAPSASSDPLRASGAPRGERTAVAAGAGCSSPAATAAVASVSYASGGALPAALDASPSSFQNYETAKWAYALRQSLPRCV